VANDARADTGDARTLPGRRASRIGAVFALGCLMVGACSSGSSSHARPPVAACVKPPAGIGPDAVGTLQLQDQGRSVCLGVDQELTVFLRAPNPNGPLWGPIEVSDSAVLQPGNLGIMTLVRGVTGGVFRAHHAGIARLHSARAACDTTAIEPVPKSGCHTIVTWSATVVVT
jgi:hypothetical protein